MTSKTKNSKSQRCGNKKRNRRNHTLYDYHLAIKQTENDAKCGRHLGNYDTIEKDGWHLPGTKEPGEFCGKWNRIGCINEEQHERLGFGRKDFVMQYKCTCKRADCRICVDSWIIRNADRAAKRIEKYAKDSGLPAFHLALSPSKENQRKSEGELRHEAMTILHEINCKGGSLFFHPFSRKRESTEWRDFPHFHFVGFGWMRLVKEVTKKYGWVVVYFKKRKYLFGTFCYLFNHCGVKKGRHAVTWLMGLSYGKLRIEKRPKSYKCPACKRNLVPIYYDGVHSGIPPDKEFADFVDPEGWHVVKTLDFDNKSEYGFEYDPRKETNEILKCITLAN